MAGQIPGSPGAPAGGTIDIFGHKISKGLAIAGALASLVALFLVLRARSQGGSAAVGSVPASANTGVNPAIDNYGSGVSTDYSAALDNIESQISQLQQTQAQAPTTTTPSDTPASTFHFGAAGPAATGWEWLPSIANQYGLPTGVQPLGSAPTNAAAFKAAVGGQAVPLADSWGYV